VTHDPETFAPKVPLMESPLLDGRVKERIPDPPGAREILPVLVPPNVKV
jgi:hypothetical protein